MWCRSARAVGVAGFVVVAACRAVAGDTPDVGADGPRCTLREGSGALRREYEPYPYETADVRGGADCVFSVDPALTVRVHLVGGVENEFVAIDVLRLDGSLLQSLALPRFAAPPPRGVAYFAADDVDFDGHRDLGVLVGYRPPGNAFFKYWVYDADTGRFIERAGYDHLSNPTVDPAAKELVTYSNDGGNGTLYRRAWHRFEKGDLRLLREEVQTWVDGHYERTVKDWRGAAPIVVSRVRVPEHHVGPYDAAQWELVKSATVSFGRGPAVNVLLLRSREVTGESGVGGQLHDVNLVIARGDDVLYRFKPGPPRYEDDTASRFVLSDRLEVRDVTGDGVPEIIFAAGYEAASSWDEELHVIRYDAARQRFDDVRDPDFDTGALEEFRWTEVDARPVALRAEGQWADGESHYEPHYYEYRAYCWSGARRGFTRIWSGRSHDRHEDARALDDEIERILPEVRTAVRRRCDHVARAAAQRITPRSRPPGVTEAARP